MLIICVLSSRETSSLISMEDNPFNHGAWEGLKQYAAEQLLLYPASKAQLIAVLNRHHVPFHEQNEALCIHTGGMLKTMSVLRLCERYIQRFENHPGNIEELYLQMLQEEQV